LAAVVGIPHELRPDVFNETHFTDVNWDGLKSAYEKSKAIAEQKSWAFVKGKAQKGEYVPEMVTICPGFICGPFLSQGSSASTSVSAIAQVMNNSLPGIPHISFPSVDVRDVALAHLRALEKPEAAGQRFILVNSNLWFVDIGKVLDKELSPVYKCSIPTEESAYCMLKFASYFNSQAKAIVEMWGLELDMDNSKSKQVLGIEYTDINTSLIETAHSLIKTG